MLKNKWVPFIFFIALAFAISIPQSITRDSLLGINSDNHHHQSNIRISSERLALSQFSNSDFLAVTQDNLVTLVNWIEEDEYEEDGQEEDYFLEELHFFLSIPSPHKLTFPTRKSCGPPSSQLLVVLPLRAPPGSLV